MAINLTIFGEPKAQQRHRHGKLPGNHTISYDPSKADKHNFYWIVKSNAPKQPFDCPIRVDISFYFGRPKSHYGTGKNATVLKPNAPWWHTCKPDRDNLDKFVLDAMTKLYWRDDSMVCAGTILKQYCSIPRTEITITVL